MFMRLNFLFHEEEFIVSQLWHNRLIYVERPCHIYETTVPQLWNAKYFLLFYENQ